MHTACTHFKGFATLALAMGAVLLATSIELVASQSTSHPCSEYWPDASSSGLYLEYTDRNNTRSYFLASDRNMTVEIWAKFPYLNNTVPFNTNVLVFATLIPAVGAPLDIKVSRGTNGELNVSVDIYWTHYAAVFSSGPANLTTARISIFVNGTLAAERDTADGPLQPDDVPREFTWHLWHGPSYARSGHRGLRVWGRALSGAEINSLRYRRIWGGADSCAAGFPDLKINIPLDYGTPGTAFNASRDPFNDVDCAPVATVVTPGTQLSTGVWMQSDSAFCGALASGFPPAGTTACHCGWCLTNNGSAAGSAAAGSQPATVFSPWLTGSSAAAATGPSLSTFAAAIFVTLLALRSA
eukprot:tig00020589_g11618.t1